MGAAGGKEEHAGAGAPGETTPGERLKRYVRRGGKRRAEGGGVLSACRVVSRRRALAAVAFLPPRARPRRSLRAYTWDPSAESGAGSDMTREYEAWFAEFAAVRKKQAEDAALWRRMRDALQAPAAPLVPSEPYRRKKGAKKLADGEDTGVLTMQGWCPLTPGKTVCVRARQPPPSRVSSTAASAWARG